MMFKAMLNKLLRGMDLQKPKLNEVINELIEIIPSDSYSEKLQKLITQVESDKLVLGYLEPLKLFLEDINKEKYEIGMNVVTTFFENSISYMKPLNTKGQLSQCIKLFEDFLNSLEPIQ